VNDLASGRHNIPNYFTSGSGWEVGVIGATVVPKDVVGVAVDEDPRLATDTVEGS